MKIAILDYGMGNINSITSTLKYLGVNEVVLTSDYNSLKSADDNDYVSNLQYNHMHYTSLITNKVSINYLNKTSNYFDKILQFKSARTYLGSKSKRNILLFKKKFNLENKKIIAIFDNSFEITGVLNSNEYLDHWANKLCDEEFNLNTEIARSLYALHLEKSDTCSDISELAESISSEEYLNDKSWAKELYQKAVGLAAESTEYKDIAISIAQKEKLNDSVWARDVFEKAIERAADVNDYKEIAESIADEDGLNNKDWAKEIFQKAIDASEGVTDHQSIANSIADEYYLNDKALGAEVMKKGIDSFGITDSYEATSIAYDLVVNFDDKPWAKTVYQKGIDICEDDEQRKEVIEAIRNELEDKEWADEIADNLGISMPIKIDIYGQGGEFTLGQVDKKQIQFIYDKLKNADDRLSEYAQKLSKPNITESRKNRLQNEQKIIEELKNRYSDYYLNLPDFLGGTLNTNDNGLLFLRSAYRRQMNGDIGSTAPIVDKLMKGDITTMDKLATEFNPEIDAGSLQNAPNSTWLKNRLTAKVGTTMGQKFFSAMLLPDRDSETTEFNLLVYGTKAGQWQVDHLIAEKKLLAGEGNTEGKRITNMAPLDKDSNGLAQTASCLVKIDSNGNCYSNIVDYHPYSKWLVKNHFDDHKDDEITDGLHPLNDQSCLVHLHPSKIGDERIAKMVELLLPKL